VVQVLTPVRRSARKAQQDVLQQPPATVEPMLEATNFCYAGPEAILDTAGKGEAGPSLSHSAAAGEQ
jgi:hypothetical protein